MWFYRTTPVRPQTTWYAGCGHSSQHIRYCTRPRTAQSILANEPISTSLSGPGPGLSVYFGGRPPRSTRTHNQLDLYFQTIISVKSNPEDQYQTPNSQIVGSIRNCGQLFWPKYSTELCFRLKRDVGDRAEIVEFSRTLIFPSVQRLNSRFDICTLPLFNSKIISRGLIGCRFRCFP